MSYRPVVATVQTHDLTDLEVAIAMLIAGDVDPSETRLARERARGVSVSLAHTRTAHANATATDTYTALVIIP